ncbi:MAG: hypothetical protein WCK54_21040 [Desulfuromonadales bacterium]
MSVNSIADGVATFKLPVFNSAFQVKQFGKDMAGAVVSSKAQENSSKIPDAGKVSAPVRVAERNPVREMSHIAESYDARGNVITKFMDSSNEVIYQTPSESVLRTQELMSNTQAVTNVTA